MPPKQVPLGEKPSGKRRKRGVPRPPKRPMSSYNHFFRCERERMKSSLQGGEIGSELTRDIAQRWKQLNSKERARYEEMAAKDKKRYAIDLVTWKQNQEGETAIHSSTTGTHATYDTNLAGYTQQPSSARLVNSPERGFQNSQSFARHGGSRVTDEKRLPSTEANLMALPPLPSQMQPAVLQSQMGMSATGFVAHHHQSMQIETLEDELCGMAVFPNGFQLSHQHTVQITLDYEREIARVANELGSIGVELVIRLFRDDTSTRF